MKTETSRAKKTGRSARQNQRLGEHFHKRLASYAAAAGAAGVGLLAIAQPANAEIVYVPIHQQIPFNPGFVLDVDGTPVIKLRLAGGTQMGFRLSSVVASGYGSGDGADSAVLKRGTPIDSADQFYQSALLVQRVAASGGTILFTDGNWVNVQGRYLGFEFKLNGLEHYGWARLTVRNGPGYSIDAVLTGYAYNTVAGQQILAGQTSADPATEAGPEALANRAAPRLLAGEAPRPATLGLLALGAPGLEIWRPRKQELTRA